MKTAFPYIAAVGLMIPVTGALAQEATETTQSMPAAQAAAKDPQTAVRDIQAALKSEQGLHADGISVAVHAETVVISGEVANQAEVAQAMKVAQEQAGGVRVSSHLEVRRELEPAPSSAGNQLAGEVQKALQRDGRTANLGVTVGIDEKQVISLHGLVPSRESRQAAEEVAGKVGGVTRVDNRLMVPDDKPAAPR